MTDTPDQALAREHAASMNIDAGIEHGLRLPAGFADRAKLVDVFTFPHVDGRNQQPRRMTHDQLVEEMARTISIPPEHKVFMNNQLCEPWLPTADEALIDVDAIERGEAPGVFLATRDGVVRVDADAELETMSDEYGTATWLFGEMRTLDTDVVRSIPNVDRRLQVWLHRDAQAAEHISADGHIDLDACKLQLEFDGIVIHEWNEATNPIDVQHLRIMADAVSIVLPVVIASAREEGREEIRAHLRKALGK